MTNLNLKEFELLEAIGKIQPDLYNAILELSIYQEHLDLNSLILFIHKLIEAGLLKYEGNELTGLEEILYNYYEEEGGE